MRRHRKTSYGSGRVPVLPDTFLAGKKDHFRHQGVVAEDSSSDSGDESSLVSRSSFGPGLHRLRKTAQIVTASTGESRQLFEHITYLVDNVRTSRPDDLPKSIDAISGHCLSSGERRSIRDCGALRLLFTSPLLYVEDPSFDRRTVESLCKLLYLLSTERLVRGFIERSAKLLSFCSWALGRLNEESAAGERSEAARLPVGDSVSDSVGSPTTSAPPSPFVSVAVVTPAPLPLPSSKPAKSSDPTMSGRKRKRGGKRGRGQDRERERERGQKRNDENVDEVSSCSNDISTPTGCCSDVSAVVVGRGVGRGGVRQTSSLRLESTLSNMSTLPSPTGSDLVLLMLRRIVAGVVGMDGLDDGEVGRGGNDVEEVLKVVETSGCLKGVTRCLINMMKMIRSNGSGSGSGSGNGDGDGDGNGDDNGNGYASSDDTRRLTMLLNIIDGSCCLCPNNQKVLCGYDGGSLVPSLVDFVSERCATSDDLTLVACQLLTSITHENPVASLHMITAASTTTTTTYLKKIIMALGEKEKRRKSIQSEKGDDNDDAKGGSQPAAAATATSSVLPVLFDEEIYLLNMLTNAIEAEPKAVTGKVGARDIEVFKSILESSLLPIHSLILGPSPSTSPTLHMEDMLVLSGTVSILLSTLLTVDDEKDKKRFERMVLYGGNPSSKGSGEDDKNDENDDKTLCRDDDNSDSPSAGAGVDVGICVSKELLWKTMTCFLNLMEHRVGLRSLGLAEPVVSLVRKLRGGAEGGCGADIDHRV